MGIGPLKTLIYVSGVFLRSFPADLSVIKRFFVNFNFSTDIGAVFGYLTHQIILLPFSMYFFKSASSYASYAWTFHSETFFFWFIKCHNFIHLISLTKGFSTWYSRCSMKCRNHRSKTLQILLFYILR